MLLALTHNKIRRLLLRVLRSAGVINRREIVGKSVKLPLTIPNRMKLHKKDNSMIIKAPFTACIPNTNKSFVV